MNRLISRALLATLLLSAYTSVAQQTFNERQVHGTRQASATHESPSPSADAKLCPQSNRQASHKHHETDDKVMIQKATLRSLKKLRQE